jgi:hypothetical protein
MVAFAALRDSPLVFWPSKARLPVIPFKALSSLTGNCAKKLASPDCAASTGIGYALSWLCTPRPFVPPISCTIR